MLFTFSILVLIFHVEIFCFHVCHPPQLDGFFLLYLIFNIRFNFCITMLVYLNAVRPKHRPCLSLQRKIDMVFVPTNIVRSFFLLHFLNLLLFIHVHFYYSIFFDHTLHVPHIDTRVELIFLVLVFPALVGHNLPSFQSLKNWDRSCFGNLKEKEKKRDVMLVKNSINLVFSQSRNTKMQPNCPPLLGMVWIVFVPRP